jgi:hypothetical protein
MPPVASPGFGIPGLEIRILPRGGIIVGKLQTIVDTPGGTDYFPAYHVDAH